ncbi:hypothetical protein [Enterococcus sp. CWB-B31]
MTESTILSMLTMVVRQERFLEGLIYTQSKSIVKCTNDLV